MKSHTRSVVAKVLKRAASRRHFFDLSESERLDWMIRCAYRLGLRAGRRKVFSSSPSPGSQ